MQDEHNAGQPPKKNAQVAYEATRAEQQANLQAATRDVTEDRFPKQWRTLQAECLLARLNATLIDGDDGRPLLVVSRWALCKSFSDIDQARAWLARVTGVRA